MLNEIKLMQGINHNDFDNLISNFIKSGKADLKALGLKEEIVDNNEEYPLIRTAIITYVLSNLDVNNSEMYSNSYTMQKDFLRHHKEYI